MFSRPGKTFLALAVSTAACACSTRHTGQEEQTYPVIRAAVGLVSDDADIGSAEEKLNVILREKAGVEIDLEGYGYFTYAEEMKKNLAAKNDYDILFVNNETFNESWLSGYYTDLNTLVEEHGQDIITAIGSDVLEQMKINGSLYALTNVRDYAITLNTVYLDQDILERFGIDAGEIRTEEDLEAVYEEVHRKDPDVLIMSAVDYFIKSVPYSFTPPFGVLDDQGETYINYFETDGYFENLKKVRRWYENGWIKAEIHGDSVIRDDSHALALYRYGKPGGDIETDGTYGGRHIAVLNGEDVIPSGVYFLSAYAVSSASKDPVRAMEVLNLFYSSPEINDILMEIMYSWTVPNLFLTAVPEGYPEDIWQQQKAFNENAEVLPDAAFTFNPQPVMKEYLAVSEVYDRYRPVLENGIAEPQRALAKMKTEMNEAGIDKVIAEKNRQYKAWRNR